MISIDPIRNPRATRVLIFAAWGLLSFGAVGLALGRSSATLRATLSVHVVAEAAGQRVYVLQNDGVEVWHRARLWLDERYFAEQLEVVPGLAWRLTGGEMLDLQTAPLALVDPFYSGVRTGLERDGAARRGAPPDHAPQRARVVVGPDTLTIQAEDIVDGNSPTP